ncbi:MAG: hypothetical protein ACYDAC_07240 [Candidatus Dormibacteria bacterium]
MSIESTTTTTEITAPAAIAVDGGVDLLLPPSTPRDVLDVFVASCNIGACDCATTFVAKIAGVELYDEPGRLRVQIIGDVTPEEVLAEMVASAPQLSSPSAAGHATESVTAGSETPRPWPA